MNNEAHGAKNNERHVCARRRVGEPAVSSILVRLRTGARFTPHRIRCGTFVNAREMVSEPCLVSAQVPNVKEVTSERVR